MQRNLILASWRTKDEDFPSLSLLRLVLHESTPYLIKYGVRCGLVQNQPEYWICHQFMAIAILSLQISMKIFALWE